MKKTVLNVALSTAFILTLGASISACSSDKEGSAESGEVLAVDRVDAAAELARKNAPEAEDMDFPETAPMPVADAEADAAMATTEEAGTSADMPAATDTAAGADMPAADSTDMPATDTAEAAAEPAVN